VTEHRTAEWTSRQMVEAFGDGKARRFMIRDRDAVYGLTFRERVKALGIEEVVIAPHSPWLSTSVVRAIGTLRREYLDHVVACGPTEFRGYLGFSRITGRLVAIPVLNGLRHDYRLDE
jgi:hypothetical protein